MSLAASSYPLLNLFWTMFIPLIGVLGVPNRPRRLDE